MHFSISSRFYGHRPADIIDDYLDVEVTFAEDEFSRDHVDIYVALKDSGSRSITMDLTEFDYIAEQVEKARAEMAILAEHRKED